MTGDSAGGSIERPTDHRLVLAVGDAAEELQVLPAEGAAAAGREAQSFALLTAEEAAGDSAGDRSAPPTALTGGRLSELAEPLLLSSFPESLTRGRRTSSLGDLEDAAAAPRVGEEVAGSVAPMGDAARALTIAVAEPDEVQQTAYLFDMRPEAEGQGLTLAVPRAPAPGRPARPAWLCGITPMLELPSNVQSVRLEYDPLPELDAGPGPSPPLRHPMPGVMPAYDAKADTKPDIRADSGGSGPGMRAPPRTPRMPRREGGVRLVVEKRVPLVGWALLGTALLASQSAGAVVNVQAFTSSTDNVRCRCEPVAVRARSAVLSAPAVRGVSSSCEARGAACAPPSSWPRRPPCTAVAGKDYRRCCACRRARWVGLSWRAVQCLSRRLSSA
eukprot:2863388-Prymnesium_polylepis.1